MLVAKIYNCTRLTINECILDIIFAIYNKFKFIYLQYLKLIIQELKYFH